LNQEAVVAKQQSTMAVNYNFSTPYSDFVAATPDELAQIDHHTQLLQAEWEQTQRANALLARLQEPTLPMFSHTVSFASPETDFTGPGVLDMAIADQHAKTHAAHPTLLSFSSPESDFVAFHVDDTAVATSSAAYTALSFASPESDFSAPLEADIAWSEALVRMVEDRLSSVSYSSPESDYCAEYTVASTQRSLRLGNPELA
jgi:hypothetical protein